MAEPGWYPQDDGSRRYWDGQAWTNQFQEPVTAAESVGARMSWLKTRTALGVGCGVLGLILGSAMAGGGGNDDSLTEKVSSLRAANTDLEADLSKVTESAQADQSEVDEQIADEVAKADAAAKEDQRKAVATAVALEKRKGDLRVRRAKAAAAAAARSLASSAEDSSDSGSSGSGTDPRFNTCGEANDNGYGPYREGADPEYDWYQDRDSDGVVCES
jgi:hypothetical protein